MKKSLLKKTIITGALCTALIVPSFVQGAEVRPTSTEDEGVIPISHGFNHWAQDYIYKLSTGYDVTAIFDDKDLDDTITAEDFQKTVRLTVDQRYDSTPDAVTREAVVYELTKIWAQKTGQDLDSIPVIQMLIYSDTDKIDGKYNHGITVANAKDIAKGKGEGVFDPKAKVTYGEFAVLLNNVDRAIKNEMEQEGPSVEEGLFETKGSYEIQDNKVVFNFELANHYSNAKRLKFGSGQQFEVTITDEKGKEVYRYSDGKFFTMALVYKDIEPGEALKWQDEWDMTNKEGEKLTSGEYTARIKVMVFIEDGDEKIAADQLTTDISFSLNGAEFYDLDGDGHKEKLVEEEDDEGNKKLIIYKSEGDEYKELGSLNYESFSVGDLDGDDTLEIASIIKTDDKIPSVKLQVHSYIDGSFELEYERELDGDGYPDQVIIGAAAEDQPAIFIDMGVGAHSGVTEILIKEDGEYKSALAQTEMPLTFKPYPLFSKDINGDGIIEVGIQAAPPETDHLPMAGIPWINCWYQWDGQGGLNEEPVMEEHSNHTEGYQFVFPENWRGKFTIERETDEGIGAAFVRFIYLGENEERAELLAIHHVPKEDWEQKKQQLTEDDRSYMLLGQNDDNMLVALFRQNGHDLSEDNLKEYEDMLLDEEGVLERFGLL